MTAFLMKHVCHEMQLHNRSLANLLIITVSHAVEHSAGKLKPATVNKALARIFYCCCCCYNEYTNVMMLLLELLMRYSKQYNIKLWSGQDSFRGQYGNTLVLKIILTYLFQNLCFEIYLEA